MVNTEGALRFRALDVRVRYVVQTRSPGDVAIVTVDFEPLPDGTIGFEFVDGLPATIRANGVDAIGEQGFDACLVALREGIRESLRREDGHAPLALRVTLRHAAFHPVDTAPRSFREAGRRAARAALGRPR